MFAFLDDRLFLAQQEVTLDDVPLSDTGAKVVFHHNVVSFPKDVNMQRLVYRQAVVFDGVFYQQLEADGGNPAVCPLQLFIHIDAYGILVAHPYQVEVGTQEIQLFAYRHGVALQVLDDVTVNARQILKEAFRQCTVFHYQFGQNAEVIEHEMRVYPPNWQKK